MKRGFVFALSFVFSLGAIGQDTVGVHRKMKSAPGDDKQYCAVQQDGTTMLTTKNGKTVTSDITLTNGTKLNTDAEMTKKDGTVVSLRSGECVDKSGFIIEEARKTINTKDDDYPELDDH